ncbi:hypothetical protein AJ78_05888 [Emergomyces pasteurianus Ep9510]|uniref:Uncharacterized protein n=1 Tax=Emergomyces pasteurianus Ep9510 TaxID=1447872 RepID=A0A1J9PAT7_9EURO|nr:hypothetical protein AJ78_05888 [Emergomyces pasteurianus Ep9510]
MAPTLRALLQNPQEPVSTRPVRSTRKRLRTYREDSSDDDSPLIDNTVDYGSDPFYLSPRRRPLTYRESRASHASTQTVNTTFNERCCPVPLLPKKVTRASSTRTKHSLFSNSSRRCPKALSPNQKLQAGFETTHLALDYVIPPWQKLPYHILWNIFSYAFSSSSTAALSDVTKSVRWLLNSSRLCRDFFEPAIATLYYSPPLFPPSRLVGLVHLLAKPQETLFTNYRNKVKRLDIPFRHYHVRHSNLAQLIAFTPQLQHVRFDDTTVLATPPPVHVNHCSNAWEIFLDALDMNNIRLRSWAWNGEFLSSSPRFQPQITAAVHRRPAFTNLRSLQLLNLPPISATEDNANSSISSEKKAKPGGLFAFALSLLSELQELELNRCDAADDNFFSCLDLNLRSLKLVNCENITSTNLGMFLARRGKSLHELLLGRNRYLNLSFTVNLATSCPHLKAFILDLNFTSPFSFTHDVEPYFEELLHDSEAPSWPTSLQILKLERLRKWDLSTAIMFFDSLVSAAPYLPNLRILELSAILEIGWRDRASFRREWVGKLERTYRRGSPPTKSYLEPIHEQQIAEGHTWSAIPEAVGSINQMLFGHPRQRHSTRIAHQRVIENSENSDYEQCKHAKHNDHRADAIENAEFIHGMCDVVEIRVDNLRPADYLLTNDNLEEDDTGDEDWNGQDSDEVDIATLSGAP